MATTRAPFYGANYSLSSKDIELRFAQKLFSDAERVVSRVERSDLLVQNSLLFCRYGKLYYLFETRTAYDTRNAHAKVVRTVFAVEHGRKRKERVRIRKQRFYELNDGSRYRIERRAFGFYYLRAGSHHFRIKV